MTIEREYSNGPYIVQCNDCGEVEELEGASFNSAVADAKERGFISRFISGIWHHFCGYCGKSK